MLTVLVLLAAHAAWALGPPDGRVGGAGARFASVLLPCLMLVVARFSN